MAAPRQLSTAVGGLRKHFSPLVFYLTYYLGFIETEMLHCCCRALIGFELKTTVADALDEKEGMQVPSLEE